MGVYSDFHAMGILLFGGLVSFGLTAIAFGASEMNLIYDVPPEHRVLSQRDNQPGDQSNAPGKQDDPRD